MTAAAVRAAHLVVDDEPRILTDPLAAVLLGDQAEELLAYHREHPTHPILATARAQAVCRSRAGFEPTRPAVISWLGVTVYLSEAALTRTLGALGRLAVGTELVADYMLPPGMRDADADAYVDGVAPVAAQGGEPWLTFLTPDGLTELLRRSGFGAVSHHRQRDAVDPALWRRTDALRPGDLSMLVHAVIAG